jgi:anthranilate phosphoribosyltransferase
MSAPAQAATTVPGTGTTSGTGTTLVAGTTPSGPGSVTPRPGDAPFLATLQRLAEGRDLTRAQAAAAMVQIMDGTAGEAQAAAFLMALRVKGETADEIAGLMEIMRRFAVPVETAYQDALVDIVGTGGDCLGTFNISTTAAFVVAGAGVKVAKHGNRAASSRCGSADVMEALGVRVDLVPEEVTACLDRVGIAFMLASMHHPAMAKVAAVRRALGVRTVFNFLGPLTNPAGVRRQLLGVSAPEYLTVLAGALARVGCEHALLVSGFGGMDELSVTGPSTVIEVRRGVVGEPSILQPEEYGLGRRSQEDLAGGDPHENAVITRGILAGEVGAGRDAVLLNAAAALYVAGAVPSIVDGVARAAESIDSGRAALLVDRMAAVTHALVEARR